MRFGMSDKLGLRVFGHDHGQPFLGREFQTEPDYSDEIARDIDEEIRRIVESAHQRAKQILEDNRPLLDSISLLLLKRETIEKEQFEALVAGRTELETFGPDEIPAADEPLPGTPAPVERPERDAPPRTLPRPGLAGAEARALDAPEKPELG